MPTCARRKSHCRVARAGETRPTDCVTPGGRPGRVVRSYWSPREACRRERAASKIAVAARRRRASNAMSTIARAVVTRRRAAPPPRYAFEADLARTVVSRAFPRSVRRLYVHAWPYQLVRGEEEVGHYVLVGDEYVYLKMDEGGWSLLAPPPPAALVQKIKDFGVAFACRRREEGGAWQVRLDDARGSATQPRARTILRVPNPFRTVVSVPQLRSRPNFYLSTGSSNPMLNFPNTFFRNGANDLDGRDPTSPAVRKCTPVGSWLSDLLGACCVGETLELEVLTTSPRERRVVPLMTVERIAYDDAVRALVVTSDARRPVAEELPPCLRRIGSSRRYHVDVERLAYVPGSGRAGYRLRGCRTVDILLVPFLTKFCHWRDVQLSACMGGVWDVEADYTGFTQFGSPRDGGEEDRTILDFGAVARLKHVAQHYDHDGAAGAFVERDSPLRDLSDADKVRLRAK